MNTAIFIVTFARDAKYLELCLRTIKKFATGFSEVVVAVPSEDTRSIVPICMAHGARAATFTDTPGKGHLQHQVEKVMADTYMPSADFICHVDSDCIFKEPVTPADYFVNGKPVLCIATWDKVQAAITWKAPTEKALGIPLKYETMRRHPAVHHRGIYADLRNHISSVHHVPVKEYILNQTTQPVGFSEFNALGSLAILEPWADKYHIIDVSNGGWPVQKLVQFWSHSPVNARQCVWINGVEENVVPQYFVEHLLK